MLICPFACDINCVENLIHDGIFTSIVCVSLAVVISSFLIVRHLQFFNLPYFQSKIIIILMMAPFYGIISILSLKMPNTAAYLELFRDIYLAFLLFTFFYLMFSYMAYDPETKTATDDRVYETMINNEEAIYHLWPFNYCTDRYLLTTKAKAKYFTYRCKKFVLQYFVLKPVLTIFIMALHPFLGSRSVQQTTAALDLVIIISESFSLYYLILFYYALKKPLEPHRPLLKFLIIKITLFFTFWQNLTLNIFEEEIAGCFETNEDITEEILLSSIENTLVCIEMLAMTIACIWAFTYKGFQLDFDNQTGTLGEVFWDNWEAFRHDFRLIRPKKFGQELCRVSFTSRVRELELVRKLSQASDYEVVIYEYPRLSKAVNVQYM